MKKLLSITLIILSILSLCSCGGPYSGKEGEVREILLPLLQKDAELSSYIWGDAFEIGEEVSTVEKNSLTALYKYVADDSPYKSCDELRAAASEIYSDDLMAIISAFAFDNNDTVMSRFCDADSGDVRLKIDVSQNHGSYNLTAHIFTDTLRVTRSTATIIECEVEFSAGDSGERRSMTVKLIKEEDTWKLDSQTWVKSVE